MTSPVSKQLGALEEIIHVLQGFKHLYPSGIPLVLLSQDAEEKSTPHRCEVLFVSAGHNELTDTASGSLLRAAVEKGLELPYERVTWTDQEAFSSLLKANAHEVDAQFRTAVLCGCDDTIFNLATASLVTCVVVQTVSLSSAARSKEDKRSLWKDLQTILHLL